MSEIPQGFYFPRIYNMLINDTQRHQIIRYRDIISEDIRIGMPTEDIQRLYGISPDVLKSLVNLETYIDEHKFTEKEADIYRLLKLSRLRVPTKYLENYFQLTTNSLMVHISRINKKVGYKCIENTHGSGYIFREENKNKENEYKIVKSVLLSRSSLRGKN